MFLGLPRALISSVVTVVVVAIILVIANQMTFIGLLPILALAFVVWLPETRPMALGWLIGCRLAVFLLCLGLMTHNFPGFNNPQLWQGVLSSGGIEHQFYWNWDKLLLVLTLLPWVMYRDRRSKPRAQSLAMSGWVFFITILSVLTLAWLVGLIRWDMKWDFIASNAILIGLFAFSMLVMTVAAEECIFRGFLQKDFTNVFAKVLPKRAELASVIVISGLFFGAVHVGFSSTYAILAGVAGIGYGLMYWLRGSIISAITLHFALNSLHFIFFSYPILSSAL